MNNCSLFTSNFPTARKLAEAVPFTKEGDHKIASNNRPLSLPRVLSKIYDKAVLAQFISYLYKHAQAIIQPPERKSQILYSTETNNIAVTDALFEAMDAEDIFYPYPTWSFKTVKSSW